MNLITIYSYAPSDRKADKNETDNLYLSLGDALTVATRATLSHYI